MKVVVAHNRYVSSQPSGENTIVDAEIAQLASAGITVLPLLRSSDDIAALPIAQRALLPLSPIHNRWTVRELDRLLAHDRPDVVHLHNPYPLLSPAIVTVAARHGLPVLQTVHNYRQVCPPGTYFRDGHMCTDCRGKAFATPAVRHACYRGSRPQSLIMATSLAVHRHTWRTKVHYIALTDAIAEHLRDFGVPPPRITVKPNGVDDPGPPPATPGDGFIFVGRLTEEKGLRLLLDAWSRHRDGSLGPLRIVGDGPLRSLAQAAASERGDIVFSGHLPAAGTRAAMREAGTLIAPSIWADVLPTVIIEALANGRPTLGTHLGGIPYVVGDVGWIVPPTAAALAAALPRARAEAAPLAGTARRRYEQEFTPQINTARLINVYERLVQR